MLPTFVRFRDLKARGIVSNWPQLRNLQQKYGFPAGRLLAPNTRDWDEENEIQPWLDSRPVESTLPKGTAKKRHENGEDI